PVPRSEMKLIIEDDEGRKTVVQLVRDEITIGRQDGNTIRLTERNVSRRHARLVKENGNVLIEDLGSYNGVRVNGEKITGRTPIIRVSDINKAAPQVEVRDLERSQMPRLVGLAGPFRGKELYLMRTEVKFGRTDENDIVADHQSVSRAHARFVLDEGQWKVID